MKVLIKGLTRQREEVEILADYRDIKRIETFKDITSIYVSKIDNRKKHYIIIMEDRAETERVINQVIYIQNKLKGG